MTSESQDDLLVAIALASLSYEFEDVDQPVADRAWALSREYARRQGLDPGEAIEQFDWSDGAISLTKNSEIVLTVSTLPGSHSCFNRTSVRLKRQWSRRVWRHRASTSREFV